MHGLDISGGFRIVAEQPAQLGDLPCQGVLRDMRIFPDGVQQFALLNQSPWVLDQKQQHLESLRLDLDHSASFQNIERLRLNLDIIKKKDRKLMGFHSFITKRAKTSGFNHD